MYVDYVEYTFLARTHTWHMVIIFHHASLLHYSIYFISDSLKCNCSSNFYKHKSWKVELKLLEECE